jgi:hypothetical protein
MSGTTDAVLSVQPNLIGKEEQGIIRSSRIPSTNVMKF